MTIEVSETYNSTAILAPNVLTDDEVLEYLLEDIADIVDDEDVSWEDLEEELAAA